MGHFGEKPISSLRFEDHLKSGFCIATSSSVLAATQRFASIASGAGIVHNQRTARSRGIALSSDINKYLLIH
jgi:hypothetical protein